ncbi:response regulator transcription factor [Pedobacter xixiisoli]|uniref:Two component transcriptional regulator, LuxR family n=1 Tax=Pedobacter xixiisoli TaxID=1476464 RepID=A0A285ZSL2_9SPHI|nr:response regulator transcription factor [Pedobacter xixiisoli]SOD12632.1 two component transcriptional regulator, LuxR family [Pedobacter xixiisoli]
MSKHIVICDDHQLFLNGIAELFKNTGRDYRIAKFNNVTACKEYISNHAVDVFICDLNIDSADGFLLLDELKHQLKNTKKIILTAYYEDFLIQKARRMGMDAFLKKETTAEELMNVIEADLNGAFYVNGKDSKSVGIYREIDVPIINKFRISKQEKEVIKLIIKGLTSKEIADALFVSKTTVDTHRRNIHKKLEITNSSSLIKFAHENNLLS